MPWWAWVGIGWTGSSIVFLVGWARLKRLEKRRGGLPLTDRR